MKWMLSLPYLCSPMSVCGRAACHTWGGMEAAPMSPSTTRGRVCLRWVCHFRTKLWEACKSCHSTCIGAISLQYCYKHPWRHTIIAGWQQSWQQQQPVPHWWVISAAPQWAPQRSSRQPSVLTSQPQWSGRAHHSGEWCFQHPGWWKFVIECLCKKLMTVFLV